MRRTRLPRTLPLRRSARGRAENRAGSFRTRGRRRAPALRSPRTRSSGQASPSLAQPVSRSLSAIWKVAVAYVAAGLPPSLKLRRTAEALAEAGQTRHVVAESSDPPL